MRHHLLTAALLGLVAGPARATKPCGPMTYAANPTRPAAEFRAGATWVAVGVVVDRRERKEPFPNCALEDRSRCAMRDASTVRVKVERYEQGSGPVELVLGAASCAPDPPGRAGGRYRFYGTGVGLYVMYEELPEASGRAP
jgi:hypothetical protein